MNTATGNAAEAGLAPQPGAVAHDGLPGPQVGLDTAAARGIIEVLQRLQEFFGSHAEDAVRAQLRSYCAKLGQHPVCGASTLQDQLGLCAWSLQRALDTAQQAAPDHHNGVHAGTITKETV